MRTLEETVVEKAGSPVGNRLDLGKAPLHQRDLLRCHDFFLQVWHSIKRHAGIECFATGLPGRTADAVQADGLRYSGTWMPLAPPSQANQNTAMPLTYRKMAIADIPAALTVRFSTIENAITEKELEETYGITPRTMAAAIRRDVKGWICEDAGRLVGFAMGDRSNGEIQVLAVLPDYEDQGIGKTLLTRVRDWLFGQGHDEIWLLANPDLKVRAHTFYRRLGWHATGEMRHDDEVMILRRDQRKGRDQR